MTNLDSILKIRDIFPTKVCLVKAMVFPVVIYGCESWTIKKNWCFWTVVLEKTLESPLDCKEIQPVHPKGNQPWIFTGRTDAEAEAPVLWPPVWPKWPVWPPDVKSWFIGKYPDAGQDWKQEEKGTTEGEMFGWHKPSMSLSKLQEMVKDREDWHAAVHGVTEIQTWLSDWITTICLNGFIIH